MMTKLAIKKEKKAPDPKPPPLSEPCALTPLDGEEHMADRKTQSAKESKKVQRAQEASVINSLIRECEQGSAAILQERRRHSISSSYKKASRRPLAKNMSTAVAESSRQSLKAEAESINALVGGGLSAVRRRRKLTGASKHSVAKAAEPRQDRTARDVVEPAPPPAGAAGAAGRPSASQDAYAFLEAECTWWQRKYEKLEIENADLLDQVEALQCMLRDGGQGRRPSSFMRRSGEGIAEAVKGALRSSFTSLRRSASRMAVVA